MTGWKMVIALVLVLIGHTPASTPSLHLGGSDADVEGAEDRRCLIVKRIPD